MRLAAVWMVRQHAPMGRTTKRLNQMKRTRILVVDDSVTIRAMIETVLERDGRLDIVGIASNAERAEHLIAITNPDVITLDIKMPGMDGLELLDRIMARKPRPVIMLSSLAVRGERIRAECLERGAAACFNKSHIMSDAAGLIRLIHQAAKGKVVREEETALA
jgi:two-component system chemotaxis response regulator CheB